MLGRVAATERFCTDVAPTRYDADAGCVVMFGAPTTSIQTALLVRAVVVMPFNVLVTTHRYSVNAASSVGIKEGAKVLVVTPPDVTPVLVVT